ncbi:hypothetical protein SDJN02_00171 [Cucurbita argyrosperma subsp. argyrosperma]|nr:hypothetical protein SDJN02_00171 [Cucurbita argyrosperma subsp. argyrosperma]
MVQLMNSGTDKIPGTKRLKKEVEDSLEDLLDQFHKRSKSERWTSEANAFSVSSSPYNPLDEPSPLGLSLKKSPSLLDLIQAKLSQETAKLATMNKKDQKDQKDQKGANAAAFSTADKLKASNFPALILKIGSWEYKSRYEGDLVAKCYFAKHKLVWELLDGNLKNKIEIQWSDIVALKANYAEDGLGTLDVVLARQPLFFREINPQPKKHTLWQATADFTGGEASRHRKHFLQCSQGFLNKHFEKLVRCNPRLNFLSQQPEIVLECPYFKTNSPNESKEGIGLKSEEGPTFFSLGMVSTSGTQSPSSIKEHECRAGASEEYSEQSPSPNSGMEAHTMNEELGNDGSESSRLFNKWDQVLVPGIRPSMSVSDFVSHIEHCLPMFSEDNQQSRETLEGITQYLFGDSQHASDADEQTIMSRVNSLCSLLQKDSCMAKASQAKAGNSLNVAGGNVNSISALEHEIKNEESFPVRNGFESSKHIATSRNDSVGELLLNLPRIASLPRFFFNLFDDSDDRAR